MGLQHDLSHENIYLQGAYFLMILKQVKQLSCNRWQMKHYQHGTHYSIQLKLDIFTSHRAYKLK